MKKYVFPQYLALIIGVIIQSFLKSYQDSGQLPNWHSLGARTVFGVIVGLLVFPAVYKNSWDPIKRIFVQLCAVVTSGLGWQTLLVGLTHGA